ncbi:hypothetical protein MKW94_030335 [Papaver nudicaule]|uniref:RBR-type E3 ubiquitin transferase n=1 Tax=Papaver nudicaule TaxID=74823 RepID=A0AA41SCH1_PAPNU|nr:hypothetical protein [Papaver nudicaule]
MAGRDMKADLDFAFALQVEEALTASLIGDEQEIAQNASDFQTLELLKKLEQEEKDRLQWETEINKMKNDLKRLIHDQEVAKQISRIPEQEWERTGDHFEKPFGEASSSTSRHVHDNSALFKLYFKGLFSTERIGNSIALIQGLTAALSLDVKKIDFFCDYYPLYQYITMRHLVNQQNIATVVDQVSLLQRNFISCRPFLVARKDIKFAFKLARNAIDSQINRSAGCSSSKSIKEMCHICLEDISVGQMFSVSRCLHRYCCSCMKQHVEVKLLNGMVPQCPHDGCKTTLKLDNCRIFLTTKLIDMMSKRIQEDSIPVTEKVYCPNPMCSTLMSKIDIPKFVYDPSTREYLCGQCLKCKQYFCFKCKAPWHYDMSCRAYQKSSEDDAKLKNLANMKLWRQCKKCNHMIELVAGCYHITCRCGHEFCYTCGAAWKNKKATCTCPIWNERNLVHNQRVPNRQNNPRNLQNPQRR